MMPLEYDDFYTQSLKHISAQREELTLRAHVASWTKMTIGANSLPKCSLALRLCLHPLPQGVSFIPVHVDLTEEVKLCLVGLGKLLNLLFRTGLLRRQHGKVADG